MCKDENGNKNPDESSMLRAILRDLDIDARKMDGEDPAQLVEEIYIAFISDNPDWEST